MKYREHGYASSYLKKMRRAVVVEGAVVGIIAALIVVQTALLKRGMQEGQSLKNDTISIEVSADAEGGAKDYIKWVDFSISYEALCKAYEWDVDTHDSAHSINWIELLAYTAAKTGGSFDNKALNILNKAAQQICDEKTTMEKLAEDLKYYPYYKEAYEAALGGLVGEYEEECTDGNGEKSYRSRYGLKAYFPLARGFDYTHYDDFGAGRSYGYKRKHLGHDMMGLVGTPIIAVESGTVEALGWNQYGGWRIGIRSFDGKRYYYYAHLRQNYPYAENLEEGSIVTAGDVIGYMGHTGYSTKENVNNIEVTHLHWGLELIFDESQKESDNEIWIDIYALTRFLAKHTQPAAKVEGTKEWVRTTNIKDPAVEKYTAGQLETEGMPAGEEALDVSPLEGQEE